MIYILNHADWTQNKRQVLLYVSAYGLDAKAELRPPQCPPLATIWVYTVLQLDLGPAVLNLVVVGIFVWLKGLKLVF